MIKNGRSVSRWSLRALSACSVSALVILTSGGVASAEQLGEGADGGYAWGQFGAHNNYVWWDLHIKDVRADGDCVYIEIQPDLRNHTDPEYHSTKACPKGDVDAYSGRRHEGTNLRGVRVKICTTQGWPDTCTQVDYNPNE
ncbi:MAG: hypothetical protein ACRDU5_05145 [Mycobacterium sp.]